MTDYPQNIDYYTTKIDSVTDVKALDINDVQDAVTAIETALGVYPQGQNQGSGWTVADRLDAFINANGTLKSGAITSSDIPSDSITNTKIYHPDTFEFDGIVTPGLVTTTLAQLGQSATDVTQFTGIFQPSVDLTYDIGTETRRVKRAYIDNVYGTTTGADTLTIGVSATFDNTLIIKSASDSSTGDLIGWIGKSGDNLVIQSPVGADLELQPYEGDLLFGPSNKILNEDVYNFHIKYPYVVDEAQAQIIANSGTVSEIRSIMTVTSSGASIVDLVHASQKILTTSSPIYTFDDIVETYTTYTLISSGQNVIKGEILQVDVKDIGAISGTDIKIQVTVKK